MSAAPLLHVLGGGPWQLPTVAKAKELGLRVLVTDMYRDRPAYALADIHEVIDITVGRPDDGSDGSEVVVDYRFRATVDGAAIDVPGVMWISVRGGEIARRLDCWDGLVFHRQTGTTPVLD